MNEEVKMEILKWAQENAPATVGILTAELNYQYSEEVETDSAEMDASIERELQVWKLLAKGFVGYMFGLRKEADTKFAADVYVLCAMQVAQEYGVQPDFSSFKDMVEWLMYNRQ